MPLETQVIETDGTHPLSESSSAPPPPYISDAPESSSHPDFSTSPPSYGFDARPPTYGSDTAADGLNSRESVAALSLCNAASDYASHYTSTYWPHNLVAPGPTYQATGYQATGYQATGITHYGPINVGVNRSVNVNPSSSYTIGGSTNYSTLNNGNINNSRIHNSTINNSTITNSAISNSTINYSNTIIGNITINNPSSARTVWHITPAPIPAHILAQPPTRVHARKKKRGFFLNRVCGCECFPTRADRNMCFITIISILFAVAVLIGIIEGGSALKAQADKKKTEECLRRGQFWVAGSCSG